MIHPWNPTINIHLRHNLLHQLHFNPCSHTRCARERDGGECGLAVDKHAAARARAGARALARALARAHLSPRARVYARARACPCARRRERALARREHALAVRECHAQPLRRAREVHRLERAQELRAPRFRGFTARCVVCPTARDHARVLGYTCAR